MLLQRFSGKTDWHWSSGVAVLVDDASGRLHGCHGMLLEGVGNTVGSFGYLFRHALGTVDRLGQGEVKRCILMVVHLDSELAGDRRS